MPEEKLGCCLFFTANKLARIITKMGEEEFTKTGLSPNYAFLLVAVYNYPGISPKEISQKLHIAPSTITRFVDKLESKGLVTRKYEGKKSYIYLTEKGIEIQEEISKCWENLYHRYSKSIGYEEGKELTLLINDVSDKLEDEK
ncbi:MarR family transcriptional regulator [Wukongibacter baidiensis]|uniref:MarR family winged helix-turn-helix transcriptional regulator n=1 Tax=Wukongibacter baidiensis TaxID=1723361 RepID=UPI003D7FCFF2